MDTSTLPELLFPAQITITGITVKEDVLRLSAEGSDLIAICPSCKAPSAREHSCYLRNPVDLAFADWIVVLELLVKRYFCDNPDCTKTTFAERFPGFLKPYSRSTERASQVRKLVSTKVCAKTTEGLLNALGIGISDTTVNRLLRKLPDPDLPKAHIIGVDDWAKRKGQRYGTIIVDLEHGGIIDLLPDRERDTFSNWLEKHPEIELVSRDRARNYADAITKAAPNAIQVADRWHLLKNLSDTVYETLQQESKAVKINLKTYLTLELSPEAQKMAETEQPDNFTPAELRRKERIELALKYDLMGWKIKDIAVELNVNPKSVQRYLKKPDFRAPRQRRSSILDPYKPHLHQRWQEGCRNAALLFREIQEHGYHGTEKIVRDYVQKFRLAKDASIEATSRLPGLRSLTWDIMRKPEKRKDTQEKLLEYLCLKQPKIAKTFDLAREFAAIIRERESEKLDGWLVDANQSGYRSWQSFSKGLERDYAAVQAALNLDWSNGPTEGYVNLLKCMKRQMYGRAKDDLLRKRLLWLGRWSFT